MFYRSHMCVSQNETACKGPWSSVGCPLCRTTSGNGNQVLSVEANVHSQFAKETSVSDDCFKVKWRWCTPPKNKTPHTRKATENRISEPTAELIKTSKNSCFCGQPQKQPKVKGCAELIGQPTQDVRGNGNMKNAQLKMGNICSDSTAAATGRN